MSKIPFVKVLQKDIKTARLQLDDLSILDLKSKMKESRLIVYSKKV